MLVLTTKQLEHQGVSIQDANEAFQIRTSNKVFTRGRNFPKNEREAAVKFGHKYLDDGVFCFIAENHNCLTVWVEQKEEIFPNSNISKYNTHNNYSTPSATEQTQALPTVTKAPDSQSYSSETTLVVQNQDRKHRGDLERYYPSQSPPVSDIPAKKQRRKYRGISY
ncbi:MAG: hypothetical protein F6K16_20845 [Symploca sp. SIO2B6]|nr:hypothetical protein [Symploca sp. SIO2B6]